MYLGRAHKTALTPPTHDLLDHTDRTGVFNEAAHDADDHTVAPHSLLDLLGHDGIDHTMSPHDLLDAAAHNLLSHVGRTGVGDLHTAAGGPSGTTRHDTLNHAGIPGIPAATPPLQIAGPFTFVWAATNNVQGSGGLAFVPKLALFVSLAQEAGNTSVAMASVGFTATAFNGRAIGGHFTTQGSSNQSKGVHSNNTVGGLSPIGAPAYNIGGFTQSLTCTVFSQGGGVSVQPSSAITMRTAMIVIG